MVYEFVRRKLAEIKGEAEGAVSPNAPLNSGISILQLAQLIVQCERAFHVTVLDEDALDFACVQDFVDYIENLIEDGRDDYAAPSEKDRQAWFYE